MIATQKDQRWAAVRGRPALVILMGCSSLACGGSAPEPEFPGVSETVQIEGPALEDATGATKQLWASARDVLDRRCVVCHGCYDAPCQLKLDAYEGIERGASKTPVYDASRVTAQEPTRLFVDAHGPQAWRERDFHGVLPEPGVAPSRSVLLRMLALKAKNPAPAGDLREHFTFELDRKASCPTVEEFDAFAKEHPHWGMPYAMPPLTDSERAAIVEWAEAGAIYPGEPDLAPEIVAEVERWERFLNPENAKGQLAARYLYEHLFLASLYFSELDKNVFLRLVRSSTPPGQPVAEIATRRPFDSPGGAPFYYRFTRRVGTPIAKTHMPYALHDARMQRWKELFFEAAFQVAELPSYEPAIASNPFKAFAAIPAANRYRFLLDEAQFTMANFIKGPVCRGQVALNVIQERFWVAFIDPAVPWVETAQPMLAESPDSDMPAERGSDAWPAAWAEYQRTHMSYVREKNEAIRRLHERGLTVDMLWDGEGDNANAALTVLRHFDSATVAKGWLGGEPKTAWVIDYPLLERIHYLLAAGFDVFGNVGHQLMTRMYMDFLRMEGESNFLAFLPPSDRRAMIDAWYRGLPEERQKLLYEELHDSGLQAGVRFKTVDTKAELLGMFEDQLAVVRSKQHMVTELPDKELVRALQAIGRLHGAAASSWPEVTFIAVRDGKGSFGEQALSKHGTLAPGESYFTVLRDSAHTHVAELFDEDERRAPEGDGLTVARGFVAAYPNVLLEVERSELAAFAAQAQRIRSARDFGALRRAYGVERTDPKVWLLIDRLHEGYWSEVPIEAGLFDLSRLDPPMTSSQSTAPNVPRVHPNPKPPIVQRTAPSVTYRALR